MKVSQLAACVAALAVPIIASAGQGDPRLVNGVLEWPAVVGSEPFVIVRSDDGGAYYVAVPAARGDASLRAGMRVVVVGIEGRTPHEVTAVGLGSGANTDAALAQLLAGRSSAPEAPAATPPAPGNAPTNGAANAPANAPTAAKAPANGAGTVIIVTPGSATSVAPAPGAAPLTGPAAAAPPPAAPAPAAAVPPAAPAPPPAAPAPAAKPATTGASVPAATPPAPTPAAPSPGSRPGDDGLVHTSTPPPEPPTASPTIVAAAPMLAPRDDQRWVKLVGEVEALNGRTLVLKVEGGRVHVDVSSLRANLERTIAPGSTIKVYGVPVELRFRAMGFIDPGVQGHGANPR